MTWKTAQWASIATGGTQGWLPHWLSVVTTDLHVFEAGVGGPKGWLHAEAQNSRNIHPWCRTR
jgi:hypothetical protein